VIPDVLEIHLDDVERFGGVPVYEGAGTGALLTRGGGEAETVSIAAEDMADGCPRKVQILVPRQVELKAFGSQSGLVPGSYHLLLYMGRGLAGLVFGGLGSVVEVAFLLLGEDVIDGGSGDTEGPGGVGDVMAAGGEVFQYGTACSHGIDSS